MYANQFELSGLFILPAMLLSNRRLNLNTVKNPQSVLAHLKVLGLNSKDADNIRLIRNAVSHRYTFEEEHIVWEENRISFATIHELSLKLGHLMSWNVTLIFYSLFLVPKFGMLVAASIYTSMKNNYGEWIQYLNGLGIFYRDLVEESRMEKENTKENKVKKPKQDAPVQNGETFIIQNISLISDRLKYHMNSIAGVISELHNLIESPEEKETLQNTEHRLREGGNFMETILKKLQVHHEIFSEFLIETKLLSKS